MPSTYSTWQETKYQVLYNIPSMLHIHSAIYSIHVSTMNQVPSIAYQEQFVSTQYMYHLIFITNILMVVCKSTLPLLNLSSQAPI